jgi:DNA-binding LacI/PurR family transcriptional regulator
MCTRSTRRIGIGDMASIKDVAERAGVSTATVSHVVNETRKVRPETRLRVLNAIQELGYSPTVSARTLASGRLNLFGLIVSDLGNPFFPDLATAFQTQAHLHDFDALVMSANFDQELTASCVKRMLALQVPAVAVMTSQVHPQVSEHLVANRVCAVYMDLGRIGPFVSNISIDYEQGVTAAVSHLRSLGHRRIGFIGGSVYLHSVARRKAAFLACTSRAGDLETANVDCDEYSMQSAYIACSKLLSRFSPTAIISLNDITAIGAMHCALDRGLNVPGDLAIVGFDDIAFAEFAHPSLTTVNIPRSLIGKLAFQALSELLAEPDRPGREYRVETRLVVRESTAPPQTVEIVNEHRGSNT